MKKLSEYLKEGLLDIDDNINTDIDFVKEIKKFIEIKKVAEYLLLFLLLN